MANTWAMGYRLWAMGYGLLVIAYCLLPITSPAYGYGYKQAEDPLLNGFKSAVVNGKAGNWEMVAIDIKGLDWQIVELKDELNKDLSPKLQGALASKDMQELAKYLANLVFLSIEQKFYWNNKEKLTDYDKAKARLYSAEVYYDEILEGNVMKHDKKNGTKLHEEIKGLFIEVRKTLGSPGLYGFGQKPPQPERFKGLTVEIEKRLLLVFPFFEHIEIK